MKICIIGHTEKNYLPFIDRYINLLNEQKIPFDVIYWQREKMPENPANNEYNFFEKAKSGALNKIGSYVRYRKFVLDILKKNKYDKLIILTTVPAVFLSSYLKKHYNGKYLLDIRDYSFEKYPPYKKIVDSLIERSELTTISSDGFRKFLGDNPKLLMNHNIPTGIVNSVPVDISQKDIISIGFVGGVRYFNENVCFIDKLKNNNRIKLFYIGKQIDGRDLQEYCKEHEVKNAEFIGKYNNTQKAELYRKIDVINSIYGNSSLEVTTALPNRLYEACLLKKPIISSKGTFLGSVIEKYNLGFLVDVVNDDVLSLTNNYIDSFNMDLFNHGCEEFLNSVSHDENVLSKHLNQFIKE